ncbi:UdgX family uracil-DNA binding protein [Coralloluteibacterium stylophorae]|uniref:Type-4 uracil-DNA glycosylase n=1 Tax=Coralloluteibacterium stylophorae TaxID=1776034 RepID=A0A8J7VRN4_9GAMM|nr:UdgX family uracil-DNA binding protein [Coralloluteibacterium stylophorae]MBS7456997.1 UdgX family uracil-DNA binding protein [Coralloluteibacterium stylophorae]
MHERDDDGIWRPLARPVAAIPDGSIAALRRQAAECRACDLWEHATQTVFGAGSAKARVVLVGEQAGDREDIEGRPFVGPAGTLLRGVLEEVGIDTAEVYVTNAVKHFRFEQRGKVRLHKRANAAQQAACRQWLAAELDRIRPRQVVCLGALAAQNVFGNDFRLTAQRGRWQELAGARGMATWHPSAVLRAPGDRRQALHDDLRADLALVAEAMAED